MEREIKFRVWSTPLSVMFWFDPMWGNRHTTGGGWLCVLPIGDDRSYKNFCSDDNRIALDTEGLILLQYTNLKDKNGMEIYEGDIVKRGDEIATIFFNYSMASFDFETLGGDCEPMVLTDGWHPETHEVIGNIHQHPELIK